MSPHRSRGADEVWRAFTALASGGEPDETLDPVNHVPCSASFLGLIAPLALAVIPPANATISFGVLNWIHRLIGLCSTHAPALHLHARPQ